MVIIPFDADISGDQQFEVKLGAALVTIRMTWNVLSQFWFMTITKGDIGLRSLKCVPTWPLLRQHRAISPIVGDIMVMRAEATKSDQIAFSDLGTRWKLVYFTEEEIQAWEVENGLR